MKLMRRHLKRIAGREKPIARQLQVTRCREKSTSGQPRMTAAPTQPISSST
jgi:hypothetical protein